MAIPDGEMRVHNHLLVVAACPFCNLQRLSTAYGQCPRISKPAIVRVNLQEPPITIAMRRGRIFHRSIHPFWHIRGILIDQ